MFSWREYRFLQAYEPQKGIESAAQAAEMSTKRAERFLRSKKFKSFAACLQQTNVTAQIAKLRDRWWARGERWMQNNVEVSKTARMVWQEFGDRLEIKPSRNGLDVNPKVTLNITLSDLQEAQRHHEAVTTSLVEEPAS